MRATWTPRLVAAARLGHAPAQEVTGHSPLDRDWNRWRRSTLKRASRPEWLDGDDAPPAWAFALPYATQFAWALGSVERLLARLREEDVPLRDLEQVGESGSDGEVVLRQFLSRLRGFVEEHAQSASRGIGYAAARRAFAEVRRTSLPLALRWGHNSTCLEIAARRLFDAAQILVFKSLGKDAGRAAPSSLAEARGRARSRAGGKEPLSRQRLRERRWERRFVFSMVRTGWAVDGFWAMVYLQLRGDPENGLPREAHCTLPVRLEQVATEERERLCAELVDLLLQDPGRSSAG